MTTASTDIWLWMRESTGYVTSGCPSPPSASVVVPPDPAAGRDVDEHLVAVMFWSRRKRGRQPEHRVHIRVVDCVGLDGDVVFR
jgi:hypothetical protein